VENYTLWLALPVSPAMGCPDFAAAQPSLVLLPMQDKTEGEFFKHHLQDLTHLLDCPASEPLWRATFGTTSSIFDLSPRP